MRLSLIRSLYKMTYFGRSAIKSYNISMNYLFMAAVLACVWYGLARLGAHIVFRPQKKRWPLKLPFENTAFDAPNGKKITGVYLPAKQHRPTLLFFHGRGGNVSHFEQFAQAYAPLGYGIFMFDYRGFGLSRGTPSQKTVFEDALAAARYLMSSKQLRPQEIVLYGHSLGNAPALHTACALEKLPLKALILQSPFLSTPDMAVCLRTHRYDPSSFFYRLTAAAVTPFLCFNRFENTRPAAQLKLPVLVCMSRQDATIPWRMSARLADYIPHAKRFLSEVGGHDEFAWSVSAADAFIKKLP